MNERPGKQAMSQTDTSAVMNTVLFVPIPAYPEPHHVRSRPNHDVKGHRSPIHR